MAIYYKATRLNGKDFRTNTVQFMVGQSIPAKPAVDNPECCTSDVYHASVHPHATLIGCSWPCRLFEVEGEPVTEEDDKRGFYTFRVVREIEAWRALGPNGREAAALIERCKTLTPDEIEGLATAWYATRNAAWGIAGDVAWDDSRGAAWGAARGAAGLAVRGAVRGAARDAVWDAVWDAVGALIIRDLISEEHFNALYEPWRSVIKNRD